MNRLYQKIAALGVVALALAGCQASKASISSTNVYQGYPCDVRCGDFQDGYDGAKSNQLTSNERCETLNSAKRIGCLSYVQDYQTDHEHEGGYVWQ